MIFDHALVTPEMQEEEYRVNNSKGAKESFATLGNYIAADLDRDVVGERSRPAPFPILLVWGEQDKTVPLGGRGEGARAAAAEPARAAGGGRAYRLLRTRRCVQPVLLGFLAAAGDRRQLEHSVLEVARDEALSGQRHADRRHRRAAGAAALDRVRRRRIGEMSRGPALPAAAAAGCESCSTPPARP